MKFYAIKGNAQNVAGILIGKLFHCEYSKEDRETKWFSTVAANLASQGVKQVWLPLR
jgi:hypothetical protein